jgi:hypothetical protein
MGQWNDGPFDNDGALDQVFALLNHLLEKVERLACGPYPRGSSVLCDAEALAANVERLALVAGAAYRSAMFAPVRGMPLPDAAVIDGWRQSFIGRYRRVGRRQVEGTRAEIERYSLEAAAPLARLGELSRQQDEQAEATHREVWAEVLDARLREQAEEARAADPKCASGRRHRASARA